jgi:prepilin-type N-terminal cleavage/methylation domain-containing protein
MFTIKRGFTLFELLIVVIIISLVYMLIIPTLKKKQKKSFRIENLKSYLSSYDHHGKVTLLCLDDCKKCYIYAKNKKQENDIVKGDFSSYTYKNGHLEDATFSEPKYVDIYNNICFKYQVNSKKDLGDEIFVKYNKKVYFFSPYFNKPKIFSDLSDASDYYTNFLEKLKD